MAREIIGLSVRPPFNPSIRILWIPIITQIGQVNLPLRWQFGDLLLTTIVVGWQSGWRKLLEDSP